VEVNFEPRHLLKETKNELQIPGILKAVLQHKNSIMSILKTTPPIWDHVRNETFYETFLLSFFLSNKPAHQQQYRKAGDKKDDPV
jgi:hypothetical protein